MRLELTSKNRPFDYNDPGVLLYYDGPLLLWLPTTGNLRYLAFSLFDFEGYNWPFIVMAFTAEQAAALEANQITLLAAFEAAQAKYLLKDYGATELDLEPLPELPDDYLPGDAYLTMS